MKILFLHSGDRVPSARFRVLPYLQHFRDAGHTVHAFGSFPQKYDFFSWMGFRPSQFLKRHLRSWQLLLAKIKKYDCVFVDRELFDSANFEMEERFAAACRTFVLDVDDAVFFRYPEKYERLARMSDLVIAGNKFIDEYTRPFNDRIRIVPTCVQMADYPAREWPANDSARPVVGWMGTTGNLDYINVCAAGLRDVAARYDFEMRFVVPDLSPLEKIDLTGVNVTHVPWHGPTEVAELQKFDVGLMPLYPDRDWDRYKCGLKLIQYMAVGVPGIASPVGVNADIISDGVTGMIAASDADWIRHLESILESPALRQEMGTAARRVAADKYSIEANFPLLESALQDCVAGR